MAGIRGDDEGEPLVGQEAMRLGTSFFMFGMLIAMQFSVVTAAAGDLVGDKAPKSAVLTAYTLQIGRASCRERVSR